MHLCNVSAKSRSFFPVVVFVALLQATPGTAAQFDLHGPAGSGAFGTAVAVLPNGNVVVTDPDAASGAGAVYLYSPRAALINSFTGSATNDRVGGGGISVLTNGNFVISSPDWGGGAGAATWVDGETGLSGSVSAANSLVGSSPGDNVGFKVTVLGNSNYVVASPNWANGSAQQAGAATWCDGSKGLSGTVSSANSLVGSKPGDQVGGGSTLVFTFGGSHIVYFGGVTPLRNGNYVVASPNWANGGALFAGAATPANGNTGLSGAVSPSNSLIGTATNDNVGFGGVTELANGNYVVASPNWSGGTAPHAGAATWINGSKGLSGAVSASNSLVGTNIDDRVGAAVTALTNGNYVVASPEWGGFAGAVTWADGSAGVTGAVTVGNSLVGMSSVNDSIGFRVTALSNGNYVVASPGWSNGVPMAQYGAVTWADGSIGLRGTVSVTNSLVGTTPGDDVGFDGVTALDNGNYVVASSNWNTATAKSVGAVTWADGSKGLSGAVSSANSLVGTKDYDAVGNPGVTALTNGNYVVASSSWNDGIGAVTWSSGIAGLTGIVSAANSLLGTTDYEGVGYPRVAALSNGNYVVQSFQWNDVGAYTWADGNMGLTGTVSAANSLIGGHSGDGLGGSDVTAFSDGNFAIYLPNWTNGGTAQAGAVSFGLGTGGFFGPVTTLDSVLGSTPQGGYGMVFAYDGARSQLVVGQPAENVVTFFRYDVIFNNGFEAP